MLPEGGEPSLQRVVIDSPMVSVDGGVRPDLSRSFADALAAALLKSGRVDVLDASGGMTGGAGADSHPIAAAVSRSGADIVLVPTLVSESGFFKLSIKKVAAATGRIAAVVEDSGSGPLPRLYEAAGRVVDRLIPPAAAPASPPISSIRGWMSGPADVEADLAAAPEALPPAHLERPPIPTVPPRVEIAERPKPDRRIVTRVMAGPVMKEIEDVGRVTAANANYSFCVIDPRRGRSLQPGQRVMIRVEGWVRPTLPATITRIEQGQAIAEYHPGEFAPPPVPRGARVYEWVPDPETDASPAMPPVPDPTPPSY